MKVIALGHKKRQFKDRFASELHRKLSELWVNLEIQVIPLITPVKIASAIMFGHYKGIEAAKDDSKDKVIPEVGMTLRQVYIALANAVRKQVSSRFLVDRLLDLTKTLPANNVVIIPDLRFMEEINRLKAERDVKLIKVTRRDFHAPSDECDSALEQFHGWDDEVHFSKDADQSELADVAQQWIENNREWLSAGALHYPERKQRD